MGKKGNLCIIQQYMGVYLGDNTTHQIIGQGDVSIRFLKCHPS